MTCRRIEHGFWKQERTGCLRACADDFMVKTFRVTDASIRDGKDERNSFSILRLEF